MINAISAYKDLVIYCKYSRIAQKVDWSLPKGRAEQHLRRGLEKLAATSRIIRLTQLAMMIALCVSLLKIPLS